MNIIAIIPARMGSTRFPGKPLADIHGTPMLGHVYFRCKMNPLLKEVYIATCDKEIMDYAHTINAPCIMTSEKHERCSDRTAEAMQFIEKKTGVKTDIVVMVQGDEPMVTPNMIDQAIQPLLENIDLKITNLMAPIKTIAAFEDPNEVKVVTDLHSNAIYFSREAIPSRKKGCNEVPMHKQVCIIPFRRDYLLHFNALKPTPLEQIESVDMMRILENGEKIKMVKILENTHSVDTPEDLLCVIELMKKDKLRKEYEALKLSEKII